MPAPQLRLVLVAAGLALLVAAHPLCAAPVAAATPANLLAANDWKSPAAWGTPVSIPADTGEFSVQDSVLTLTRKRPAGDFKLYRVIDKLPAQTDYCLRLQLRVAGPGQARVYLIQRPPGKDWVQTTPIQSFGETEAWQSVELAFRTPDQEMPLCLQLHPPAEVGARVSVGPLLLCRAADLRPAAGDEETYPCFKLGKAPRLDGDLSDEAWRLTPEVIGFSRLQSAPTDDGLQVLPEGIQADQRRPFVFDALTYFQAAYTDEALYLAIRLYQPGSRKLPAAEKNSPDLWQSDCAEIHLVPGERATKLQLLCNPAAAHWPEGWTVATSRQEGSWLVEAAIPFAMLGATPQPGARWRANLSRNATTPRETLSTWAPGVVNFHDEEHYRWFEFKGTAPAQDAKALAEAALNQSFYVSQRQAASPTGERGTEDRVRTLFQIHTRNVNAALFVNGTRLPLQSVVWTNSYAGFVERTLRAVADISEGDNVVGVVAQAAGAEPGIRLEVSRAETDRLWKCSPQTTWEWLKPGYDDAAWSPLPAEPGRFVWRPGATDLCLRQVIRGVEQCAQNVPYTVTDWKRHDLGRHRAIVRVPATLKLPPRQGRAVWAHLPWRRRDDKPADKAIRILDAKTGLRVDNIAVVNCKREYGDIVFEPPTVPGDYEVYYLPYVAIVSAPCYWNATDRYLTPHDEPDPNWLTAVAWAAGDEAPITRGELPDISRGNWQRLPRAELVEFQAKTEFDRLDPMEVCATAEETSQLVARAGNRQYLIFPEDRKYPVRMFQDLPLRWIRRGPTAEFSGEAQPGEYYCFQLGMFASEASFSDLKLTCSDLIAAGQPAIPATTITCFNLGGTDWLGRAFTQPFNLARGKIRPLWIGLMVPEGARGTYHGTVTVEPQGLAPQTVALSLQVAGGVIASHGEDELWRHARLRWLDSTLGLDDDWLVPPYTPLKVAASRIECLDRAVDFDALGLPQQVTSRGNAVLSAPIRFVATRDKTPLAWRATAPPETPLQKAGKVVRQYHSAADGISALTTMTMEFDGCLQFDLALTAEADTVLQQVGLDVPFARKIATYIAGANAAGGYRPAARQWTFDAGSRSNSKVWIGDVNAGMQLKVTAGRGVLEEAGEAVFVRTRQDTVTLKRGEPWHFTFRLLVTPFKPISKQHWTARVGDPLRSTGPGRATVMHIHHASVPNPWINYPFLTADKLRDLQRRIVESGGLGVQLYYTVRELTNRPVEVWALRSLGGEVLPGAERCYQEGRNPTQTSGHPWLREHFGDGFYRAWRTTVGTEIDAAVATRFLSRWHNYYIAGLDWLLRNKCFYSLYLDGIGYDREITKRVARVMSRHNPNYRMEHHQCTGQNDSVANADLEHLPYATALWYGEGFNYNRSQDYWLVDVSGIPFGLTGEMLDNTGTVNMWRAMLYFMTGRIGGREHIWTLWDEFGIKDAEPLGYWDPACPVKTDQKDVLASVYRKPGKSLIALASWSRKDEQVRLTIDWQALGLDPATVKLSAPPVTGMQEAREFRPDEPIPVKQAGGWFLIAEQR